MHKVGVCKHSLTRFAAAWHICVLHKTACTEVSFKELASPGHQDCIVVTAVKRSCCGCRVLTLYINYAACWCLSEQGFAFFLVASCFPS